MLMEDKSTLHSNSKHFTAADGPSQRGEGGLGVCVCKNVTECVCKYRQESNQRQREREEEQKMIKSILNN